MECITVNLYGWIHVTKTLEMVYSWFSKMSPQKTDWVIVDSSAMDSRGGEGGKSGG